jgi:hypothetical protein
MNYKKLIQLIIAGLMLCPFVLTAKDFKGGEIRTTESFLYGRFEVKMKSAKASGVVSAFFTFYDQPDFTNKWNEIDVEILGRYEDEVQFNGITGKHVMNEHRQKLLFNPHSDYHVYAFEWTPEYIAWFVDGNEVYRNTGDYVTNMSQPQKIMLNFWATEFIEWSGKFDGEKLPLRAEYDYVKYSSYDAETRSFSFQWKDDFDKLDLDRWAIATHTFDGNKVDFAEENVKVKNGILTLLITKSELQRTASEPGEDSGAGKGQIEKIEHVSDVMVRVWFEGNTYAPQVRKKYFRIEGLEILKVKLHADLKTLDIFISKPEPDKEYVLEYSPENKEIQKFTFK